MHKMFGSLLLASTLLFIIFSFLSPAKIFADTQTWQINASANDAWDNSGGTSDAAGIYSLAGRGLSGTSNYVGMRFTNITIPKNALITSAYMTVHSSNYCCDYNYLTPYLYLKIRAQNVGNTTQFDNTDTNEPQGKAPTTTAGIDWDLISAWTAHTWYDTPDISSVLQEVVNRSDWSSGNSMILLLLDDGTATGQRRHVETYDYNTSYAEKLTVTWDLAPSAPTSLQAFTPGVSFSAIGNDPNITDTLNKAQVQVDNNSDFSSPVWDSGVVNVNQFTQGQRSPEVAYTGSALSDNTPYYYRMKFQDTSGALGAWSTESVTLNTGIPLWDVDNDYMVSTSDVSLISSHWGNTANNPLDRFLDLNGNGTVDINDIQTVSNQLGMKENRRTFESGGGVTFAPFMTTDLATNWGHNFSPHPLDYNSSTAISRPGLGVYHQIMKLNQNDTNWQDPYPGNYYGHDTPYGDTISYEIIGSHNCQNTPAASANVKCLRRFVYENPSYTWILGEEPNWYSDANNVKNFPSPEVYTDWYHDAVIEIKAGWSAAGALHGKLIGFYFAQDYVTPGICGRYDGSDTPMSSDVFLNRFEQQWSARKSAGFWTEDLSSMIDGVEYNYYPYCAGSSNWDGAGITHTATNYHDKRVDMLNRPWLANKELWGSTGKGTKYDLLLINSGRNCNGAQCDYADSDYVTLSTFKSTICEVAARAASLVAWAPLLDGGANNKPHLDMLMWYTTIAETSAQGYLFDSLYRLDTSQVDGHGKLIARQGALSQIGLAFRNGIVPSSGTYQCP